MNIISQWQKHKHINVSGQRCRKEGKMADRKAAILTAAWEKTWCLRSSWSLCLALKCKKEKYCIFNRSDLHMFRCCVHDHVLITCPTGADDVWSAYMGQHVEDAAVSRSVHSLVGGDKHSQGSWTLQGRGWATVLQRQQPPQFSLRRISQRLLSFCWTASPLTDGGAANQDPSPWARKKYSHQPAKGSD